MTKKVGIFGVCFFLVVEISLAVSPGGEIFDFLKIIPSPYLQALGGFNASWPQKIDVLLVNPAAAPQVRQGRFQFNSGYLGESLLNSSMLFRFRPREKNFFMVSMDYLIFSQDKPLRTVADSSKEDGYSVLGEINPYFYNLGFGWARPVGKYTSFGSRLKIVGQQLDQKNYSGVALDLGILYHPVSDMPQRNILTEEIWNLGAGIINLGPEVSGYSLPLGGYLGVSRMVSKTVTFGLGGVYYQSGSGELNSGVLISVLPAVALAVGYNYPLKNDNLVEQFYERFRGGFSLTFGVIGVSYAFVPRAGLGNNHFLGVVWIN